MMPILDAPIRLFCFPLEPNRETFGINRGQAPSHHKLTPM